MGILLVYVMFLKLCKTGMIPHGLTIRKVCRFTIAVSMTTS